MSGEKHTATDDSEVASENQCNGGHAHWHTKTNTVVILAAIQSRDLLGAYPQAVTRPDPSLVNTAIGNVQGMQQNPQGSGNF